MKRVFNLFLLLILLHSVSLSQGINNQWIMGYSSWAGFPWGGVSINFSNGFVDTSYIYRTMNLNVTNSVICDTAGNLLFYSNGCYIANKNDVTMLNGDNLNPGQMVQNYCDYGLPIPQGQIVLPMPGDSDKYYLIHEVANFAGPYYTPLEIFYSIIDKKLDNGKGGVTTKNNIILNDTLESGELSATKHANGRDWWMLFHKVASDKFYIVLVTPYGFTINFQNIGTIRNAYGGASSFSSDGSKFSHYNSNTDLDIYDFDRCTGLLSNFIHVPINDSSGFGAVAFSPNNRFLYAVSSFYVYQLDLLASNVPASIQTVAVYDGFYSPQPPLATSFLYPQLAPDGRIYIVCGNSTLDIHKINYPDSLGLACDVQQHSVHLPAYNAFTIANHPNYFLGSIPGGPCDSLTPIAEIKNNTIPIRINPNPAQNKFYLNYQLPFGKTAIATVYNTLGQAVMRKNLYWYFGYLEVDCSGLENGVYVVKVETKGYLGAGKLVIAR